MASEQVFPEAAAFSDPAPKVGWAGRMLAAGKGLLRGKAGSRSPGTGAAVFLDADKLSRRIRAHERGANDGRDNVPPVHATNLSEFEAEVLQHCKNALGKLTRQTTNLLLAHNSRQMEIDIGPIGHDLDRIQNAAMQQFLMLRSSTQEPLIRRRQDELTSERNFRHFAIINQLNRPPRSEKPMTLTIGILILIVVVEAFINAIFLQELGGSGLTGGFLIAAAVSIVNVTLCFAIGMFVLRNTLHIKKFRRVAAVFGFIVCLVAIGFLHYFLGQVRAAAEIQNAMGQAASAPTNMHGLFSDVHWPVNSWLLFFLGLFFSGIAIVDGFYLAGDVYPGYSAVAKAREDAAAAFDKDRTRFLASTQHIINQAKASVDRIVGEADAKLVQYTTIIHETGATMRHYNEGVTQLETVCDRVWKTYRDANLKVRSQIGPAYFESTYAMLDRDIGMDVDDASGRLKQMNEQVDAIKQQGEDVKDRLQTMLDSQLRQITDDLLTIDATAAIRSKDDAAAFNQAAEMKI